MALPRVAATLPLLSLLLAGCVSSEVVCDPLALPGEAVATFVGEVDGGALRFALQEAGWREVATEPGAGTHAAWLLDDGSLLHLAVVEERSALGVRTVLHAWGGAGVADEAAAERMLAPYLEPTLLYLEPHLGRPATVEYAGGACE